MKRSFVTKLKLSKSNIEKLYVINSIITNYMDDGYTLTLRQLYYQLVSRDIIPNESKEYSKLSNIVKNGRMAGIIDWNGIEDRIRVPKLPYYATDIDDAVQDTIDQYRLDRQQGQAHRVEVWVEKDALSAILYRATSKYHVRLMVNRGYSSISALYRAYLRLNDGDTILYFGDHDPSGMDMIRDIKHRMSTFGLDINVVPVALTMAQIEEFSPPPNPAKLTDPRASWYVEKYGTISWELDALPPHELLRLVENSITNLIDMDIYESMLLRENVDILKLKSIMGKSDE